MLIYIKKPDLSQGLFIYCASCTALSDFARVS